MTFPENSSIAASPPLTFTTLGQTLCKSSIVNGGNNAHANSIAINIRRFLLVAPAASASGDLELPIPRPENVAPLYDFNTFSTISCGTSADPYDVAYKGWGNDYFANYGITVYTDLTGPPVSGGTHITAAQNLFTDGNGAWTAPTYYGTTDGSGEWGVHGKVVDQIDGRVFGESATTCTF